MLSLLFKEKISDEQDEYLFNEFKLFPMKYEHDISGIDMKLSIYIRDKEVAQRKSDDLKAKGFKFISQIHNGKAFFHDSFVCDGGDRIAEGSMENAENAENIVFLEHPSPQSFHQHIDDVTTPTATLERKPTIRSALENMKYTESPPQPPPGQKFVTMEQFEELSKKAKEQLNAFSVRHNPGNTEIDLMGRVEALSASAALQSTGFHHSGYSAPEAAAPHHQASSSNRTVEFKAKNELIANGIRCEKCNKKVKEVEPISKLIMAVREHVTEHFDKENPILKRFQCRECQNFQTNFVDDFEKHLKKHGTMMSVPEKRQRLTVNLLTDTHLKLISDLCNECFPEVFEKTPPALNTIMAVDTPVRAKLSVFPHLDRLYCTKFNIPYSCNGRTSHPIVNLD